MTPAEVGELVSRRCRDENVARAWTRKRAPSALERVRVVLCHEEVLLAVAAPAAVLGGKANFQSLSARDSRSVLAEEDDVRARFVVESLSQLPRLEPAPGQPVDHPGTVGGSDDNGISLGLGEPVPERRDVLDRRLPDIRADEDRIA